MMINKKYGVSYEMSQVMINYINCLKNKSLLKKGIAIFNSKLLDIDFIDDLYKIAISKIDKSPNSLHLYGNSKIVPVNIKETLISLFSPFINEYFGMDYTKKMLLFHDFSVHYGKNYDKKLITHVDDSDITINICLKNNLLKTELEFTGIVDTLFSNQNSFENFLINLEQGDILIHRGNHPHKVNQISTIDLKNDESERVNAILWFKYV